MRGAPGMIRGLCRGQGSQISLNSSDPNYTEISRGLTHEPNEERKFLTVRNFTKRVPRR